MKPSLKILTISALLGVTLDMSAHASRADMEAYMNYHDSDETIFNNICRGAYHDVCAYLRASDKPTFLRNEIKILEDVIENSGKKLDKPLDPLNQGLLLYIMGAARQTLKHGHYMKLEQVHKNLTTKEKLAQQKIDGESLIEFQTAKESFTKVITPDKLDDLNNIPTQNKHNINLFSFVYAHTLRKIAILSPDLNEKMQCLDDLIKTVDYLEGKHRDVCLNAGAIYTGLAYVNDGDLLANNMYSVEELCNKQPEYLRKSIEGQRKFVGDEIAKQKATTSQSNL
jgi:hypothetical protein